MSISNSEFQYIDISMKQNKISKVTEYMAKNNMVKQDIINNSVTQLTALVFCKTND